MHVKTSQSVSMKRTYTKQLIETFTSKLSLRHMALPSIVSHTIDMGDGAVWLCRVGHGLKGGHKVRRGPSKGGRGGTGSRESGGEDACSGKSR